MISCDDDIDNVDDDYDDAGDDDDDIDAVDDEADDELSTRRYHARRLEGIGGLD